MTHERGLSHVRSAALIFVCGRTNCTSRSKTHRGASISMMHSSVAIVAIVESSSWRPRMAVRRRYVPGKTKTAAEPKLRRRVVWWDALSGEPRPVAEPGEELHVHHWMLPDED